MGAKTSITKRKRRRQLLEYLSDPGNPWLSRNAYASEVLGYAQPKTLWKVFSPSELEEIEAEALVERRKRISPILARVDQALFAKAQEGDLGAIEMVYKRFEAWSDKKTVNHEGKVVFGVSPGFQELLDGLFRESQSSE